MQNQNGYHANNVDVAIVGGGLAGLAAATYLARAGLTVTLFEKAQQVGGRATTQARRGFLFNLGPHALYVAGAGRRVLRELGISYVGRMPSTAGLLAVAQNELHLLPATPGAMLQTRLLGAREKISLMRLLAEIILTQPETIQNLSVQEWLAGKTRSVRVQQIVLALGRLTTYANAPDMLSAAVALHQIQMSLKENVYYLDRGWQTLVDGLRQAALTAGAHITTGARVTAINDQNTRPELQLANGRTVTAGAIILAIDPATASRLLLHNQHLQQWAATAVPVRAAVLDVALERLPQPERSFALGIEQPLYLAVHSKTAQLSPAGGALIHLAKYLPPAETDAAKDEAELLALLDLVQPGWHDLLVERRFLPRMVVVNRLAPATEGGLAGRPGFVVPDSQHLYLAGDWIGPEGWLADASLASARHVTELILSRPVGLRRAMIAPAQHLLKPV